MVRQANWRTAGQARRGSSHTAGKAQGAVWQCRAAGQTVLASDEVQGKDRQHKKQVSAERSNAIGSPAGCLAGWVPQIPEPQGPEVSTLKPARR